MAKRKVYEVLVPVFVTANVLVISDEELSEDDVKQIAINSCSRIDVTTDNDSQVGDEITEGIETEVECQGIEAFDEMGRGNVSYLPFENVEIVDEYEEEV